MLRVAVILLCLVPLFFTVEETDHLNKNKVLQDKTKDEIIRLSENKQLVVLQFGSKHCRHSRHMLQVMEDVPRFFEEDSVSFFFIDCIGEMRSFCVGHEIKKFPTVKFVNFGVKMKSEYRGQRSAWALREHIDKIVNNRVQIFTDVREIDNAKPDKDHRSVIGFFKGMDDEVFIKLQKISGVFKDQCNFYAFFNGVQNHAIIAIRDSAIGDDIYTGDKDLRSMFEWIAWNCKPLVPEMRFENAEEIIENNLPLLILYRNTKDTKSVDEFTRKVNAEMKEMVNVNITAVHVDGYNFRNALRYANKIVEDMPLIAVDTYMEHYTFDDFETAMNSTGALRKFVTGSLADSKKKDKEAEDKGDRKKSIFYRLRPSNSRYSFMAAYGKDEL